MSNEKMLWVKEAICKGQTEIFFPNEEEARGKAGMLYRIAKQICKDCPVRKECLEYSISEQIFFGVFGGKTPNERKDLYRQSLYAR
jgi:WhiB family redox-sensing transcriptional regulator